MTLSTPLAGAERVVFREQFSCPAPYERGLCIVYNMPRVRQEKRVLRVSDVGNPRLVIRRKARFINGNDTNVISFSDL